MMAEQHLTGWGSCGYVRDWVCELVGALLLIACCKARVCSVSVALNGCCTCSDLGIVPAHLQQTLWRHFVCSALLPGHGALIALTLQTMKPQFMHAFCMVMCCMCSMCMQYEFCAEIKLGMCLRWLHYCTIHNTLCTSHCDGLYLFMLGLCFE